MLNQSKLCVGNPDEKFSLLGKRKRAFKDRTGVMHTLLMFYCTCTTTYYNFIT